MLIDYNTVVSVVTWLDVGWHERQFSEHKYRPISILVQVLKEQKYKHKGPLPNVQVQVQYFSRKYKYIKSVLMYSSSTRMKYSKSDYKVRLNASYDKQI